MYIGLFMRLFIWIHIDKDYGRAMKTGISLNRLSRGSGCRDHHTLCRDIGIDRLNHVASSLFSSAIPQYVLD